MIKDIDLKEGEYHFEGTANLLYSYSAIDYKLFIDTINPSGGIALTNVTISQF